MPRPPSSFYSQDERTPNNLGYKPFEYWKGPKPVVWPSIRQPNNHGRKHSSSRPAARVSAKAHPGGAVNSLRQFEPIQPSKLYSAQQFVASLQAAKLADTKHDSHTHVEYVGSRGDIGQFRASGDIKSGGNSPWDADDKGKLRLAAIQESSKGWAESHPGDYKTPSGVQVSHKELSRSHSTRSSPPDYADLPPLNMKKGTGNLPQRYYGDERGDKWWDFKTWRRRTWAILVAIVVVIIIVIVIVVTMLQKNNAYPNYKRVAEPLNLTYASTSSAVLRVDTSVGPSSSPDASTGRFSVRATSKKQYNAGSSAGLFLFDVKHTPYGCGTWPALWLADPSNWPDNGENDVMEATNLADGGNAMTLHTSPGCSMDHKRKMTGSSTHSNCASSGTSNTGCGVDGSVATYGEEFNSSGGGIMALEWRSAGIRMWQFARGSIPSDITGGSPDPSTWGTALADFPETGCDVDSHFRNQSIIMNIDLCGDLAGNLYGDASCPSNCTDFVANNPDNSTHAYWEVGIFQVYTAS
ncbi:hypothetical protein INS49_014529 [Diaporthe citri]|uniref:uncharacterized protein n=1 Tax=Diaporthe citri TaxID=83186 RepID=UPI001C823476|nr:uncharacterized protein INS49_014529 [Diaporthe citri]KAG6356655.1 hypothetical protein INS49_014529 [Diaporthe citri]